MNGIKQFGRLTIFVAEPLLALGNKADGRMHIGETVVELTSFSVRLFFLINVATDGGAVLCRMTHLSQQVP